MTARHPGRKTSEVDRQHIVSLLRDGLTYRRISEIVDFSESTIIKIAKSNGLLRKHDIDPAIRSALFESLMAGETQKSLCQRHNLKRSLVNNIANRYGLSRNRSSIPLEEERSIVAAKQGGESIRSIAARTGRSTATVCRVWRRRHFT